MRAKLIPLDRNSTILNQAIVIQQESNFLKLLSAALIISSLLAGHAHALSPEEKMKRRGEVTAALDGTAWQATLVPQGANAAAKSSDFDTLTFRKGMLTSQKFSEDGYAESNITVTVNDDGVGIWETMQNSEGKSPIFWRGEMHAKSMSGILSQEQTDGTSRAFSFRANQSTKPEKAGE